MSVDAVIELKEHIRDIPDFPKPGILFRDITPLLANPIAFQSALKQLAKPFENQQIKKVIGIESRGFVVGAPLAYLIGAGFVPVRKKGKLPYKTTSVSYELEYGQDTLEMHLDGVIKGEKTIIIDDLLATGGTAKATCDLVVKNGGNIAGLGFLIELKDLNGRKKIDQYPIHTLVSY